MAGTVARRRGAPVWDPFEDVFELARSLGRLPVERDEGFWTPLADVEEQDDAWVIELEVPGVDKSDLAVEVNGRQVMVSGERKEKERTGVLRRRTRVTGQFQYAVTLGTDIDPDGVEAHLADGVLTLRIPKHEAMKARTIEVK